MINPFDRPNFDPGKPKFEVKPRTRGRAKEQAIIEAEEEMSQERKEHEEILERMQHQDESQENFEYFLDVLKDPACEDSYCNTRDALEECLDLLLHSNLDKSLVSDFFAILNERIEILGSYFGFNDVYKLFSKGRISRSMFFSFFDKFCELFPAAVMSRIDDLSVSPNEKQELEKRVYGKLDDYVKRKIIENDPQGIETLRNNFDIHIDWQKYEPEIQQTVKHLLRSGDEYEARSWKQKSLGENQEIDGQAFYKEYEDDFKEGAVAFMSKYIDENDSNAQYQGEFWEEIGFKEAALLFEKRIGIKIDWSEPLVVKGAVKVARELIKNNRAYDRFLGLVDVAHLNVVDFNEDVQEAYLADVSCGAFKKLSGKILVLHPIRVDNRMREVIKERVINLFNQNRCTPSSEIKRLRQLSPDIVNNELINNSFFNSKYEWENISLEITMSIVKDLTGAGFKLDFNSPENLRFSTNFITRIYLEGSDQLTEQYIKTFGINVSLDSPEFKAELVEGVKQKLRKNASTVQIKKLRRRGIFTPELLAKIKDDVIYSLDNDYFYHGSLDVVLEVLKLNIDLPESIKEGLRRLCQRDLRSSLKSHTSVLNAAKLKIAEYVWDKVGFVPDLEGLEGDLEENARGLFLDGKFNDIIHLEKTLGYSFTFEYVDYRDFDSLIDAKSNVWWHLIRIGLFDRLKPVIQEYLMNGDKEEVILRLVELTGKTREALIGEVLQKRFEKVIQDDCLRPDGEIERLTETYKVGEALFDKDLPCYAEARGKRTRDILLLTDYRMDEYCLPVDAGIFQSVMEKLSKDLDSGYLISPELSAVIEKFPDSVELREAVRDYGERFALSVSSELVEGRGKMVKIFTILKYLNSLGVSFSGEVEARIKKGYARAIKNGWHEELLQATGVTPDFSISDVNHAWVEKFEKGIISKGLGEMHEFMDFGKRYGMDIKASFLSKGNKLLKAVFGHNISEHFLRLFEEFVGAGVIDPEVFGAVLNVSTSASLARILALYNPEISPEQKERILQANRSELIELADQRGFRNINFFDFLVRYISFSPGRVCRPWRSFNLTEKEYDQRMALSEDEVINFSEQQRIDLSKKFWGVNTPDEWLQREKIIGKRADFSEAEVIRHLYGLLLISAKGRTWADVSEWLKIISREGGTWQDLDKEREGEFISQIVHEIARRGSIEDANKLKELLGIDFKKGLIEILQFSSSLNLQTRIDFYKKFDKMFDQAEHDEIKDVFRHLLKEIIRRSDFEGVRKVMEKIGVKPETAAVREALITSLVKQGSIPEGLIRLLKELNQNVEISLEDIKTHLPKNLSPRQAAIAYEFYMPSKGTDKRDARMFFTEASVVYSYIPDLLQVRGPAARSEFCPYTKEVEPLFSDLSSRGRDLADEKVRRGILEYVRQFGLLNLPCLANAVIDLLACESEDSVVAALNVKSINSKYVKDVIKLLSLEDKHLQPHEIIERLKRFQSELVDYILVDKELPPGLEQSELGMELFNAIVPHVGDYASASDRSDLIAGLRIAILPNKPGFIENGTFKVSAKKEDIFEIKPEDEAQEILSKKIEALEKQMQTKAGEQPLNNFLQPWREGLEFEAKQQRSPDWWFGGLVTSLEKARSQLQRKLESITNEKGRVAIQRQIEAMDDLMSRCQEEKALVLEKFEKLEPQGDLALETQELLKGFENVFRVDNGKVDSNNMLKNVRTELHALFIRLMAVHAPNHFEAIKTAEAQDNVMSKLEAWGKYFYEEFLEHFSRTDVVPENRQISDDLIGLMQTLWRTRGIEKSLREVTIFDKEGPKHALADTYKTAERLKKKKEQLIAGEAEFEEIDMQIFPCMGIGRVLAGDIANACYDKHRLDLAEGRYPKLTALLMKLSGQSEIAGSTLCIDTRNTAGERVLVIRALNPSEAVIQRKLEPESVVKAIARYFIDAALKSSTTDPEDRIMEVRLCYDHKGGHSTNRQPVFDAESRLLAKEWKETEEIKRNKKALASTPETNFNNYNVWTASETRVIWRRQEVNT